MARKKKSSAAAKRGSAPKATVSRKKPESNGEAGGDVSRRYARTTAPRELADDKKRAKWRLPLLSEPDKRGDYIIELNVQHVGGIPGAATAFEELFRNVIESKRASAAATRRRGAGSRAGKPAAPDTPRKPLRIAKSYYRCEMTDNEWHALLERDEQSDGRYRTIYRLWPDFPVHAQTDRSVVTVKADAALRSFNAAGASISWAVIDSGIQASHPHFGKLDTDEDRNQHTLWALSVRDL
ncbi:MAG TPA: hypothetical protein VGO53_15120, partial [Steroidobacteraceae bacterium]|nr:hypothetical protein [Steroidobacteraceae bacterium]